MKKTLSHLPKHKRDELKLVVERIRQLAAPEMIILFGSFARGDWVENIYTEGHITYEYKSDFDILVLVGSIKIVNSTALWRKVEKKVRAFPVKTWTNIIVHTAEQFNDNIKKGQYFFSDIKKEGIVLYDSGRFKLARRRKPDPAQRKQIAQQDFKQWFENAHVYHKHFEYAFRDEDYKKAAFELHQMTEALYTTIMLVFRHYKPKTHDLEKLGRMVAGFEPKLLTVFPQATEQQRKCFDLLKRAYVEARYHTGYKITPAQLEYLAERVKTLRKLTKQLCEEKTESFV